MSTHVGHDRTHDVVMTPPRMADGHQGEVVVEYEHTALVGGVRVKIDGYCWVFHIRDGRFDSMREYINPSNPATSILLSLVLRAYPFLTRWRARGTAAS